MNNLPSQWKRPRVGEWLKLRNGSAYVRVISVRRTRDILLGLSEAEAIRLGADCLGTYGAHWMDIYYEALVTTLSGEQGTARPIDVYEVTEREPQPF